MKKISIVLLSICLLVLAGCSSDKGGAYNTENTSLGKQLDYKIIGIDAGAGVVQASEKAVEDYGLDYTVQTSSGAAMTQALADAYENEEPIIVTGWSPHWKFSKYDLKYL